MYASALDFSKIGLIKFDRFDTAKIPNLLKSCQRYVVSDEEKYIDLLRWLTNQPKNIPAPIGNVVQLQPAVTKLLFAAPKTVVDFGDLCSALDPLLKENKRIFDTFGPNSGTDSAGPLRREFSVWEDMKRSKMLAANLRIQELIERNNSVIPGNYKSIFDALRSHIDAFRVNIESGPIDYRHNQFPREVSEIVASNVKQEK